MRSLKVSIPAACGEIIEGVHQGRAYLASYCIDLFNSAEILADRRGQSPIKAKARSLLAFLEDHFQLELKDISIYLKSMIPVGKGLASSSADLAAILVAINEWFGLALQELDLYRIMCQFEVSDANLFRDLSLVAFQSGQVLASWPWDWDGHLKLALVLPHERVDSQAFYQTLNPTSSKEADPLYEAFIEAMDLKNWEKLAQVSFQSGDRHQSRLANPYWSALSDLHSYPGIYLMNRAHSGTAVALIFDPFVISPKRIQKLIRNRLPAFESYQIRLHDLLAPGPRIESR